VAFVPCDYPLLPEADGAAPLLRVRVMGPQRAIEIVRSAERGAAHHTREAMPGK